MSEGAEQREPAAPVPARRGNPLVRVYRAVFADAWDEIDGEAATERAALAGKRDARPMVILIVVALVMVFQEYYGDQPFFRDHFGERVRPEWLPLAQLAWWSCCKLVGYLLVTLVLLRELGMSPGEGGLSPRGLRGHLWIYAALYAAIFPVLVYISGTPAFQNTYPFYRLAPRSWPDFLVWEALYGSSFVALEFFFRGLMLFPLRRSLGSNAIFVMCVPYCMVHFHKPVPEVVGAVFAGVLLGTLALRTRSVWGGVLLHVAVAWSMDVLAVVRSTGLPGSGRWIGPP